jgi:predicted ArsR family transcriptional regulator
LNELTGLFSGRVEIIADEAMVNRLKKKHDPVTDDEILALLGRRPCTASDISRGLGIHINEITKKLETLMNRNLIKISGRGNQIFYTLE